jgi:hypothetical protein
MSAPETPKPASSGAGNPAGQPTANAQAATSQVTITLDEATAKTILQATLAALSKDISPKKK